MEQRKQKRSTRLLLGVMAIGMGAGSPCVPTYAQTAVAADANAFRVVSSAVHAEDPVAEACVTFSAPLILDRQALAAQLQLKKSGKKQNLEAKDLVLSASEICVEDLDHGASYTLRVGRVLAEGGRKLTRPYDYAFDVPHRKPALSFVGRSDLASFPRHVRKTDTPSQGEKVHVLRSVNVGSARLTLYKLDDPESFAGAWQQFVQNAWTPSEGLYYARGKGKSVYESDLVFGDKPDQDQTLLVPLPSEADLPAGLYFLSAAPRGKNEQNPGLYAGQWFVVSDVRVAAVMTDRSLQAFVSDTAGRKPVANQKIQVLSRAGKVLSSGDTNAEGMATLALGANEQAEAALVLATGSKGDIDLLDLRRVQKAALDVPAPQAFLQTNLKNYASGSKAVVTIRLADAHGAPRKAEKGQLFLLRPDNRLHSQQEVVVDGVANVLLSLPVAQEAADWTLEWSEQDDKLKSATKLHIGAQGAHGDVEAETPATASGTFPVGLRAQRDDGNPMPFASGKLIVRAVRARSDVWKDYRFGLPVDPAESVLQEIPFIADAEGVARLSVTPETHGRDLQALELTPVLEGGAVGDTKAVKLGARTLQVGIKPMQGDRIAPGVTVTQLSVLALDGEGRKRGAPNLTYTLIEEGRSFEWFPADGYWDYKPLPQSRRVAGGDLNLGPDGETTIPLPLTPGQYAMEVTQANGTLLSRVGFVIGPDGSLTSAVAKPALLKWKKEPETLDIKKQASVTVQLDRDAMVGFIVADDRVRSVQYKHFPAGEHTLSFAPAEDWSETVTLRAFALADTQGEPSVIETKVRVHDPRKVMELSATLPAGAAMGGGTLTLPLRVTSPVRGAAAHVSVVATPVSKDVGEIFDPIIIKDVHLDEAGKGTLTLPLPAFDGELHIEASAWGGKAFGSHSWTVPVRRPLTVQGRPPAQLVQGDQADVYLTFVNTNGPDAAYTYEIKVPDGLVLKGTDKGRLELGRMASQTLTWSLEAKGPVMDQIELIARTPSGTQQSFVWPVSVRGTGAQLYDDQVLSLAAESVLTVPTVAQSAGFGILSPVALPASTPRLLHTLMTRVPVTTLELTRWLDAATLWQRPLIETGWIGASRFEKMKKERLDQLQRRQNEDGGFASSRSGRQSDLESTAAALSALAGHAEEPTQRAIVWLTQKLQNTWFDEKERPARAKAFEALDALGRADLSAVRYFAETSRDKELPVDAVSALALIFGRGSQTEDKDKAHFWLTRYQGMGGTSSWPAVTYAARNPKIPQDVWDHLHAADIDVAQETSLEVAAIVLSAYARAAEQSGTWRVETDGTSFKHYGLMPVALKGQRIKNVAGRALSLSVFQKVAKKNRDEGKSLQDKLRSGPDLSLRLMTKDGARIETDQPLAVGETYLLSVETEGRVGSERQARLIVPISGAFEARTPPAGAEALVHDYVPALSFMPDRPLEHSATRDVVRWTFDATKPWRNVLFLRAAHRGTFVWPAPLLETEDGEKRAVSYDPLRISVK